MQVRYKKFSQQPSFGEVCGPVRKVNSNKKVFAQKKYALLSSVKQKTVVPLKAKLLLTKLSANNAIVFAELMKVVKANPMLAFEDVASQVFRNLRTKDKTKQYAGSIVSTVYKIALKEGAITVAKPAAKK